MPNDLAASIDKIVNEVMKRIRALEVSERVEVAGSASRSTFANLPAAGQEGRIIYVTNGRKAGEGAGAGTGVLAVDDGTNWVHVGSDTPVQV